MAHYHPALSRILRKVDSTTSFWHYNVLELHIFNFKSKYGVTSLLFNLKSQKQTSLSAKHPINFPHIAMAQYNASMLVRNCIQPVRPNPWDIFMPEMAFQVFTLFGWIYLIIFCCCIVLLCNAISLSSHDHRFRDQVCCVEISLHLDSVQAFRPATGRA